MFEWIGTGSLMAAAWLLSALLLREQKRKLHETEALYDMIACIRDNIEHLMKPLPDIFRNYSNVYLENCGFLPSVRKSDLRSAWTEHTFTVSGEVYPLVDEFIHTIGSGYRAEELRLCDYTLGRLRKILDHMQGDAANQRKLYKTVPMMFALSLVLILI